MSDAKFDETLEAVFEERARDFSPHLREMLEQLWLEGVKEGRARGMLESSQLEQRLDEVRSSIHENTRIATRADLEFIRSSSSLQTDDVLEAIAELERQGLVPRVHDELELHIPLPKLELGRQEIFGKWMDEVASWSSPKMTSKSSVPSSILGSSRLSEIVSTNRDESGKS